MIAAHLAIYAVPLGEPGELSGKSKLVIYIALCIKARHTSYFQSDVSHDRLRPSSGTSLVGAGLYGAGSYALI